MILTVQSHTSGAMPVVDQDFAHAFVSCLATNTYMFFMTLPTPISLTLPAVSKYLQCGTDTLVAPFTISAGGGIGTRSRWGKWIHDYLFIPFKIKFFIHIWIVKIRFTCSVKRT